MMLIFTLLIRTNWNITEMPITSSAKKAVRVAKRRNQENSLHKIAYKRAIKDARRLIDGGAEVKAVAEAINQSQSALDKAVKTKLLHRNTASRLLSRLVHKSNA